jgi:integrase
VSARMERTKTAGVYKRGSRYVVVYRDPYGRQRKRSARTLKEARAIRSTLTADVARGEFRELSRITFVDYVTTWLDTYAGRTSKGVRPETLADYRMMLEKYAIPFFGRTPLTAIEPTHIKKYVAQLAERGVSEATVKIRLSPVRVVLATALEEGLIRWNPAVGIRGTVPRTEEPTEAEDEENVKALSEDELRALLAEIPPEWRTFFEFLAHTGCRIGEAIALQWRHVDLDQRRVLIRRRWYRKAFAPPKSRYGRRDIPLSQGMAEELRRLRRGRDDEALVFTSEQGHLINQNNLMRRVLKPACVRAGFGEWAISGGHRSARSWVSFHTFRHSCASSLFRAGLNAKQVQAWLGHHSPAFTLSVYVHVLDCDMPEADFLDAVTGGVATKVATEPAETGGVAVPALRAVSVG